MDPVGGLAAGAGLLFLATVLHLVRSQIDSGSFDRNSAVGIRTRATRSSDAAWTAGHQAASPLLMATALTGYAVGLISLLVAIGCMATDTQGAAPLIIALSGDAVVIALLAFATSKANRAARGVATH